MTVTDAPTTTDHLVDVDEDELTALALSADPDAALPVDAISLWELEARDPLLLPDWYMPAPMSGQRHCCRWQRCVAWLVVAAFVLIDAYGLCSTYGSIVWA